MDWFNPVTVAIGMFLFIHLLKWWLDRKWAVPCSCTLCGQPATSFLFYPRRKKPIPVCTACAEANVRQMDYE